MTKFYVSKLDEKLKQKQGFAVQNRGNPREKRNLLGTEDKICKPGNEELVMSTVKPNKLAVSLMGPGMVGSQLEEANCIVSLPKRREKNQNSSYRKRAENVNGLFSEHVNSERNNADGRLMHPSADPDGTELEGENSGRKLKREMFSWRDS